ncbi:MAG: c-type cytochrome biogenesis protein CcmI [Proteobacteria bacterium]|nr:c-type cytochrome biogenesis protein CcmI [Pseudomonadota bacterium]
MKGFIVIAAVMTVLAVLWVVVPLLRRREAAGGAEGGRSNLAILRAQLAELESDLGSGTLSADQHASARAELERRVLEESAAEDSSGPAAPRGGRIAAFALAVLIPAAALSMYLWIGEPDGLRPEALPAEHQVSPAEVDEMVARLAARLEKNPDDPRGWMMLARSYYVMQRMPEAVAAFARAAETIKDDADFYADYADALAVSQGRKLDGKPMQLIQQALKIDPGHPKALAMAGSEAFFRKDYAGALAYWDKLLPLLPPDSEMARSIAGGIAEARELGGIKAPPGAAAKPLAKAEAKGAAPKAADGKAVAGASVSGRVTLSTGLAAKAGAQDTLFIVARAVNGPRIPLAVLRKRASDLPTDFTLDDALAMSPELKISGFPEVVVTARISKSGNAISQSGDLQGVSQPVKVGAKGLAITIDSVVP